MFDFAVYRLQFFPNRQDRGLRSHVAGGWEVLQRGRSPTIWRSFRSSTASEANS